MQITATVSRADEPIIETIEERPGLPVRIRFQPDILRKREGSDRASYQPWPDVHWIIQVENLDEARLFREALAAFFWGLSQDGVGAVHNRLVPSVPVSTP